MLSEYGLPISEKEYRDVELPSYSLLSSISSQGIDVMLGEKNNVFNLKFGSLVDDLCFDPNIVPKKYYYATASKTPTPNIKKIIDGIVEKRDLSINNIKQGFLKKKALKINPSTNLKDYEDEILSEAKIQGVYNSYSDSKTIETVLAAGSDYFNDLLDAKGKIHIKQEMWEKAQRTADTLRTHEFSSDYFLESTEDVEIIYQFKFTEIINGIRVKGMLDIVVVDHINKIIYPIDLKTGEYPVEKFGDVFLMHKYYLQASLYREGLISIVKNNPELQDYTVAPFEFLYISKENEYKPLVYQVPEELHKAGLNGFNDRYGFEQEGVYSLLKKYDDCKNHRYCNYPQEIYEAGGIVILNNMIRDGAEEI